MLIDLTLTRAQAQGLLALAAEAEPAIERLFSDGRRRASAERGLDRLRGALGSGAPLPVDGDLEALADALGDFGSRPAVGLFTARIRDLLACAVLWRALERARLRLRGGPRASMVPRFDALLDPELIDGVDWRAEAVDLLEAVDHPLRLPGEPRAR